MKHKLFSFYCFVIVIIMGILTGCNSSEDIFVNNEGDQFTLATKDSIVNTYSNNQSDAVYLVSIDDVKNFLKTLRYEGNSEICPVEKNGILLYIVTTDNGWYFIAGDKRLYPIIAESEKGKETIQSIKEKLDFWIDCYLDEVRVVLSNYTNKDTNYTSGNNNGNLVIGDSNLKLWEKISPAKQKADVKTRSSNTTYKWAVVSYTYCDSQTSNFIINHLLSTKWGQETPWNTKLPTDTSNGNMKCLTGCTAVALAQMLYYTHNSIGKPNGLYHNINVSATSISGPTSNIGFSRSNFVTYSSRWGDMALNIYDYRNPSYVGDLMLDIGNRVNMSYSADGSSANISRSALSNYGITYSDDDYNYQIVKTKLQDSKPVYVTAYRDDNGRRIGHAWIIDGLATKTYHYVTEKHFEYTENWMYESEYYDSFRDIRNKYNVNSEYDYIEIDEGSHTSEYLLMNWGWNGSYNDVFISPGVSDSWIVGSKNYKYNKKIYYDFR